MRHKTNDFQRCPGCGDYIILAVVKKVLKKLKISPHKTLVVGGIGCSGKFPQYIETHGAETLHGRGLAFATGAILADPSLTIISYSGDGDTYGIGMNHFIQSCRRDSNITHIVADNENYALTTGQTSPTTPCGTCTSSTPQGNPYQAFDPIKLAAAAGCTYNIRTTDTKIAEMEQIITNGILHQGFSHLQIKHACPSRKKR